ncbi:hypothetical protein DB32_004983 [Sandaracinus amylolyticus]|uniref:Uncharacterized protein n=1 Tax=Sandaracinus amylolyticus TaxID=927083 RepID=A0A0F6SG01_9BACT|nr:hypothetical protein DB32_004983 [Sandaracinus amylolyticus]
MSSTPTQRATCHPCRVLDTIVDVDVDVVVVVVVRRGRGRGRGRPTWSSS